MQLEKARAQQGGPRSQEQIFFFFNVQPQKKNKQKKPNLGYTKNRLKTKLIPIKLSKQDLVMRLVTVAVMKESESESEVAQLCLTLCDPMDCSPPGSSVHGILQVRILEWVAISLSRGSS